MAAAYLLLQREDAATLARANARGTAGDAAGALAEARRVSRPPAAERARLTEAYALVDLGRLSAAERAFARAADADPRNWVIWRDWARVQLALGRRKQAGETMARAKALNPRMSLPPGFHAAPRRGGR